MSEPGKPLHAQVAEALGWTDCEARATERWTSEIILNPTSNRGESVVWIGRQPLDPAEKPGHPMLPARTGPHSGRWPVPRYDLDWSATGPLIEKYEISLIFDDGWGAFTGYSHYEGEASWDETSWDPTRPPDKTPTLAVCHLILALAATGEAERVGPAR